MKAFRMLILSILIVAMLMAVIQTKQSTSIPSGERNSKSRNLGYYDYYYGYYSSYYYYYYSYYTYYTYYYKDYAYYKDTTTSVAAAATAWIIIVVILIPVIFLLSILFSVLLCLSRRYNQPYAHVLRAFFCCKC